MDGSLDSQEKSMLRVETEIWFVALKSIFGGKALLSNSMQSHVRLLKSHEMIVEMLFLANFPEFHLGWCKFLLIGRIHRRNCDRTGNRRIWCLFRKSQTVSLICVASKMCSIVWVVLKIFRSRTCFRKFGMRCRSTGSNLSGLVLRNSFVER
jgi:hypothetical protein